MSAADVGRNHLPHRSSDHREDRSRRPRRAARHPPRHPDQGRHARANRLASKINEFCRRRPSPRGALDITLYRDDLRLQAARVPLADDLDPGGRHRRRAGDPRRRRPLHRAHRSRSALDALRDIGRPTRGAAGGARRPRATASCRSGPTTSARTCPPRAARTSRCRLAEDDGVDRHLDRTAAEGRRDATIRHLLSAADLTRDEAAAILDDADRFRQALRRPRGQEAADAARPHHHHDVLRELHPHPGVVRGRGQVDERRRDQRQRRRDPRWPRVNRCATPR